ncbi:MAG: hypothetical protein MUF12_09850 [Sediminibacterium sp.]|nr:hypothetical protein [Sediminibacterium sp.]
MSPHYVRCLKPNDELVPNNFDRAAVAEQLRCGGILEAVRVARAGYSNHYSHADFLRRYRCLAWKELNPQPPKARMDGTPQPNKRWGAGAVSLLLATGVPGLRVTTPPPAWARSSSSLRSSRSSGLPPAPFSTPSKTKLGVADSHSASDLDKSRRSFTKNVGGSSNSSEWAKAGIQIGKSKVFLRHKAFEALERLRGQILSQAAVKLNSMFRMYLARTAYVHVRNAVRKSMHDLHAYQNDEWKETKEQDIDDQKLIEFFNRLNAMRHSYGGESFSLVEVWASQMRESLHNPVPRSEWGKAAPSRPFKWRLVDGLWTKNHDFEDSFDDSY